MKKRGILIGSLIFVILFSVVSVSASFKYYGHSLEKKYKAGGNMEGRLNISFEKEDAESVVRSNFIGNTSLINFLTKNKPKIMPTIMSISLPFWKKKIVKPVNGTPNATANKIAAPIVILTFEIKKPIFLKSHSSFGHL